MVKAYQGVPFVWIIDPNTLESELRSRDGVAPVIHKVLHLPDFPVAVDLAAALEE
jgi:Uma2 family endonuclease